MTSGKSESLQRLAGRVPQRWRRAVPMRLRNAIVDRVGHPAGGVEHLRHLTRINLGAGYDRREGYLNVDLHDFHDPDLVGDVRSLPALTSGRYEEIIAQDVLEHLERADVPIALNEWRRLLKPGGRLYLRVPDIVGLLNRLALADDADHHRQVMHSMFGTQAYNGDFHLSGFTDVLLCDELGRAGFDAIEMEIRDEWLWESWAAAADPAAPHPVAFAWGHGFYRREAPEGGAGWRWVEPEAELLLYAAQPAGRVELALTVLVGRVHVTGGGADAILEPGGHTLALTLSEPATRLHFSSDTIHDAPGDARRLAFQLGGAVHCLPAGSASSASQSR